MDNNKLKKLGKYFTKGLQAGVLATALIAGNVSCSNAAGGDSTIDEDLNNGNGNNGGNDGNGNQGQTSQWPDYYIENGNLDGQQFVETSTDWFSNENRNQEFTNHYDDANEYINDKVTELNKLWQEKKAGSTISDQINAILKNFNQGTSIAKQIDQNYTVLAPFFANLKSPYVSDKTEYNKLIANYHILAHNAYNNSLGKYKNSIETMFTANREMDLSLSNSESAAFAEELQLAGYGKTAPSVATAKGNMNSYLNSMASRTNTDLDVLKKIVELSLYNESLYGLNDIAKRCNVTGKNLTNAYRAASYFDDYINDKLTISINNLQNIDDRTM